MIAEIHNKISQTGSNLHDRLENQLTGDFFGTLRYLPFTLGLLPVLDKARWISGPNSPPLVPPSPEASEFSHRLRFWLRLPNGEIDVLLRMPARTCGIEVKYYSPISSDDPASTDEGGAQSSAETSKHQLARYARSLSRLQDGRSKYLLLVATRSDGQDIAEAAKDRIVQGVAFFFLGWEDALQSLRESLPRSRRTWQGRILRDIIRLLERKGFDPFRSFAVTNPIVLPAPAYLFWLRWSCDWTSPLRVQQGVHYEFGRKSG
jgi:hypothetical protein